MLDPPIMNLYTVQSAGLCILEKIYSPDHPPPTMAGDVQDLQDVRLIVQTSF
jgi:hypothetical protein